MCVRKGNDGWLAITTLNNHSRVVVFFPCSRYHWPATWHI